MVSKLSAIVEPDESTPIKLHPVGRVAVEKGRFYLSIKKGYRKALKGLKDFSHIHVLWWGDRPNAPEGRNTLVAENPYQNGPGVIGIFATRSQARPNPVLITTSAIIRVDSEAGTIELPWFDAEEGTPVIDIKHYHPCSDRVKNVQLPVWCENWPSCLEDSAGFDWSRVLTK